MDMKEMPIGSMNAHSGSKSSNPDPVRVRPPVWSAFETLRNPQSTERARVRGLLKKPKGAPLNLG